MAEAEELEKQIDEDTEKLSKEKMKAARTAAKEAADAVAAANEYLF